MNEVPMEILRLRVCRKLDAGEEGEIPTNKAREAG